MTQINAYNNYGKEKSRKLITRIINKSNITNPISMVELIGGGNGVIHYANNLNIRDMLLIEENKKAFNDFKGVYYDKLKVIHKDINFLLVNDSIINFIGDNTKAFDVINLDFCAFCYERNLLNTQNKKFSRTSTIETIISIFNNKNSINKNTKLFMTFMTKGYGISMARKYNYNKIYNETKDIISKIKDLGKFYDLKIDGDKIFEYKPCKQTKMENFQFNII